LGEGRGEGELEETQGRKFSTARSNAILLAIILSLVPLVFAEYMRALHASSPGLFWLYDVFRFVVLPGEGPLRVFVVLYFALTAGFVEEIFFRGLPLLYLTQRFPKALPKRTYVIATAVCFGALHWQNGIHEVAATLVFGVFAAIIYLKLRDLWPLVGAHVLEDLWDFW
jgi:membrane protease YdiL (CAAX protease family)